MLDFSALDGLKTGYTRRFWYYVAGAIASMYGGFITSAFNDIVTAALLALAAFFAVLVAYQIFKAFEAQSKNRKSYLAFAQANGFEFIPVSDSVLNGTGTLFAHGHSKTTKNVLSGKTASGLPLQTFHYEYVTGSGKSRQTHYASVMRITLPRTLPHMVIDSLVEGSSTNSVLPIHFDQSQRVTVEGDFNKYFSLYAPDTYAVSMLSIIGPDVMWALMQHAAACDIEIIDNYIYFYWPFVAGRRSEYEGMFATADAVMKEVGKKLTKGNIYTNESQAQLHSTEQSGGIGARLKKGSPATAVLIFIVIVIAYGQPFLSGMFGIPPFVGPDLVLVVAIGFIGFVAYNHYRTQKRRRELIQRFGPSEPKRQ